MREHLETYTYLRYRGKIAEESVGRSTLTLTLKNGATVRIPMSRKIRKAVVR